MVYRGFTTNSADEINGFNLPYHHIGFPVDKQFCDVPRHIVHRVARVEQGCAADGDAGERRFKRRTERFCGAVRRADSVIQAG